MGAIDRINIKNELIEKGWRDISKNNSSSFEMIPPDSLWKNKQKSFNIYDARDLQELLENTGE